MADTKVLPVMIDQDGAADGEALIWNNANGKFEPAAVAGAAPVDSVNTQTGAVVLDTDDIDDSAATNKYTTAAEITKLSNIEANADVTDEANVTSALNGATPGAITVAGGDKVLVQDITDSDNLKTVTAQSIADLAAGGGGGGKVLQVVYAEVAFPTTGSTTSSAYATFLSASITPASTANKILIIGDFDGFVGGSGGLGTRLGVNIERGSTQIREKEALCEAWDNTLQRVCNGSIQYLDSPSTTASTTYNFGYNRSAGSGTCYYTGTTGMSCGLTLIEIEG